MQSVAISGTIWWKNGDDLDCGAEMSETEVGTGSFCPKPAAATLHPIRFLSLSLSRNVRILRSYGSNETSSRNELFPLVIVQAIVELERWRIGQRFGFFSVSRFFSTLRHVVERSSRISVENIKAKTQDIYSIFLVTTVF